MSDIIGLNHHPGDDMPLFLPLVASNARVLRWIEVQY